MAIDLSCEGVTKRFGSTLAADGVTFHVPSGRFFSILGPSGCGKTTLVRMIAGFVDPDNGDIKIGSQSIVRLPPNQRPVNVVFQNLALFPTMNVADNIGYGLRRRGLKRAAVRAKVEATLARVGLSGLDKRTIDQLSGGQKQRVAIARCLVLEPKALLLDEPLGALDSKLREHMMLELKMLQKEFGTTFVYITHDQTEALIMSDQIAVMRLGRFEQVGSPQDLYYRPATSFIAGFVGDSQRWTARVVASNGNRVQAATESGLLLQATAAGPGFTVGDRIEIFVRHEAIAFSKPFAAEGANGVNRMSGRLESLLFNGANSKGVVRLDSGDVISAPLPRPPDDGWVRSLCEVGVSFPAEHALGFAVGSAEPRV